MTKAQSKLPSVGLKINLRRTGYSRGKEGFSQILYSALYILIEEGYQAITFRNIAKYCDMKVGNVGYYFASKEDLIRELLESIISHYEDEFDNILLNKSESPTLRLKQVITFILEDISSKKTTRIFPELWALSNHDPFIQRRVDDLYRRARAVLNELIPSINPDIPAKERELLALFISASLEGLTVFAGHEKRWNENMPELIKISVFAFTNLVSDIKTSDISESSEKKAKS